MNTPRSSRTRTIGSVLLVLIGLVWSTAGMFEAEQLTRPEPSPSVHTQQTWADQFPVPLIMLVTAMELAVGATALAGMYRPALVGGLVLLGAFAVALTLVPIEVGRSCGCAGGLFDKGVMGHVHPLARVVLLSALHALSLACIVPMRPRTVPTAIPTR